MRKPRCSLFLVFCVAIKPWSEDSVRRDERLIETGLDSAQEFLCLYEVAEVTGAKAEIRFGIGQVDGYVGEGTLKLGLHGLGMVQSLIADFHEDMDSVAVKRAVHLVK